MGLEGDRMSRVFITGDMHGEFDISKFNSNKFAEGKNLTKDDYVIICGDFGLVWDAMPTAAEIYWLDWLNEKPWTTLFVDGNHENHVRLDQYEVEEWHGGKVHRISDTVYHLMRGQIYDINGYKWFTYGGAESTDKMYRVAYKSWWPQETPSIDEYNEAISNLRANDFKVDFIITHAAPLDILEDFFYNPRVKENGTPYHLHDFYQMCEFKDWYCGHYHFDYDVNEKFHMMYKKIIEVDFGKEN